MCTYVFKVLYQCKYVLVFMCDMIDVYTIAGICIYRCRYIYIIVFVLFSLFFSINSLYIKGRSNDMDVYIWE